MEVLPICIPNKEMVNHVDRIDGKVFNNNGNWIWTKF